MNVSDHPRVKLYRDTFDFGMRQAVAAGLTLPSGATRCVAFSIPSTKENAFAILEKKVGQVWKRKLKRYD